MTTRILVGAITAALLFAAPALAKGVDGVTLRGGGQEVVIAPLPHANSPEQYSDLVAATRFYEGMWPGGPSESEPAGDLGPRIIAEWHFPLPTETVVVQHLYPLAEDGPVGFVPGGQVYVGESTLPTWIPLRADIVEVLKVAGFDTDHLVGAGGVSVRVPILVAMALGIAIIGRTRIRQVA